MTDQALTNLVIAAREAFDTGCLPGDEERALDRALEPYSATVPYADEPTPPVVEEGRREAASYDAAYARGGLDALNEVMGAMGCQDTDESPAYQAVEKRREYLRTMQADAKSAILALTPVEGVGELPAIEPEGERIVAETYCHNSGMYLRTDVIGAVQTAIAEERARHAPHLVHPELRR